MFGCKNTSCVFTDVFYKFSADFFFGVAIIKVTFFYENTPLVSFIKCLLFADDLQERATILAENNQISIENLGFDTLIPLIKTENVQSLNNMEKQKIVERLHFYNGNISKTAEDLGISRAALYRKMEKHTISNQ